MENECNCDMCLAFQEVSKKINNDWNEGNFHVRTEIAKFFFNRIITNREGDFFSKLIEALNLKALSMEKFNKTLGLLSDEEVSSLADIMVKPYLNKKIQSNFLEFWRKDIEKYMKENIEEFI